MVCLSYIHKYDTNVNNNNNAKIVKALRVLMPRSVDVPNLHNIKLLHVAIVNTVVVGNFRGVQNFALFSYIALLQVKILIFVNCITKERTIINNNCTNGAISLHLLNCCSECSACAINLSMLILDLW